MRSLPSLRSSSSTNRSPSHINRPGAMARASATNAATLQARYSTAAAMAEALAPFHAASQSPQAQREHDGRDFFYRCKFCNRTFPTPQSLGGHHNSHRHLKVVWQETRGRSVRGSQESRPLQAAPPTVPPPLSGPSHQEGTVTAPVVWVVTLNLPDEPMGAILRRELLQPVEERQGARHDPKPRGCNAVRPEELSEDVMTWVEGLLVDPEEEASESALAGYKDDGGFADGSSVKMDLNLNLKKA